MITLEIKETGKGFGTVGELEPGEFFTLGGKRNVFMRTNIYDRSADQHVTIDMSNGKSTLFSDEHVVELVYDLHGVLLPVTNRLRQEKA